DIKGEIYITNSSQLGGATIDASSLLLKGDGTLFITCPIHSDDRKGLCANNYNHTNNSTTDALADDGYKVTLKSTTNNNDGTYTWEYTVEPEQ
ncbi:MAG: hypothetical protein J5882_03785, partial [Bacteroidales bacterium]|nr:hypothetical protein [Bacteroidales bacterium]